MADSKQLYQEVILDHNRKPRNWGALADGDAPGGGRTIRCAAITSASTLKLDGDAVEAIAFEGESCAICKASASMMTTAVKGKSRAATRRS